MISVSSFETSCELAKLCVAQNKVAQDVWRPIAPVIPNVRRPIATVGEAPDGGGFGGEGGGGELRDFLSLTIFF